MVMVMYDDKAPRTFTIDSLFKNAIFLTDDLHEYLVLVWRYNDLSTSTSLPEKRKQLLLCAACWRIIEWCELHHRPYKVKEWLKIHSVHALAHERSEP